MTIKGKITALNLESPTPQFTVQYFDDRAPDGIKMERTYARTGLNDDMIAEIVKEECNSLTGMEVPQISIQVGDILDPVDIQRAQDAKKAADAQAIADEQAALDSSV